MDVAILRTIPGTNLYQKKFQSPYQDLLDFCNVTNLHLEPSLKTLSSNIYHASNVLHTRIIETNPSTSSLLENLSDDEKKAYNRIRNQDSIKQEWQLDIAERYHLKACGFVHAMVPSMFIQIPKIQNFTKQAHIRNQISSEKNTLNKDILRQSLISLKEEHVGAHFNSSHFLHTRFWFFDLDYPEFVSQNELFNMMEDIGLTDYVNAIVQTSPTKYHFYLKSEMIATSAQVQNWPTALNIKELEKAIDPAYLKDLLKRHPRYTGREWFDVAKRGLPALSRLSDIPIPIPEEAKLIQGLYYGDDAVYKSYQDSWGKIAKFLNADLSTNDPMRIAQLPGYSNPKNLYQAHLVYQNKDAKVLTTKIARTTILDNIDKYYIKSKNESFYNSITSDRESIDVDGYVRLRIPKSNLIPSSIRFTKGFETLKEIDKEVDKKIRRKKAKDKYNKKKKVEKDKVKLKTTKEKYYVKMKNVPNSPEDYCRLHGLQDKVIWDVDITGHSNAMLLLFCRYMNNYIVLSDKAQQAVYFDRVIRPYFEKRTSKDLKKDRTLQGFYNRFQTLCKSGFINLQNYFKQAVDIKETKGINISNVKVLFEESLAERLGRTSEVFKQLGHEKLRKIIYSAIKRSGWAKKTEDGVEVDFYIPIDSIVKKVGGKYRGLARVYESTGLYLVDSKYKCPTVDDYGNIYRKGMCKKHTMFLNCELSDILGDNGKCVKKRMSKADHRKEDSELLRKSVLKVQKEVML